MAKREKRAPVPVDGDPSPLGVSIGALLGKEAPVDSGEAAKTPGDPKPADAKAGALPKRAVLARETKGRGGKTVTTVSFRDGEGDLPALARELRTALGCGGTAEEGLVILQGDQVQRAAEWLSARGVKVIKGN